MQKVFLLLLIVVTHLILRANDGIPVSKFENEHVIIYYHYEADIIKNWVLQEKESNLCARKPTADAQSREVDETEAQIQFMKFETMFKRQIMVNKSIDNGAMTLNRSDSSDDDFVVKSTNQ